MDEAADFLIDLQSELHALTVPADISSDFIARAAGRLGIDADVAVFQSYVTAQLERAGQRTLRLRHIPVEAHWNLWRTQQVGELASALVEGRVGLADARAALERIKAQPALYPRTYVVPAYAVYGGVVATRIGGNLLDTAAAMLVGLFAGLLSAGSGRYRSVYLQQSFLTGLLGGLLVLLLTVVLPIRGGTVLFGGVALLIPAMALTISVHEIANDALEAGVLRLVYALLRFLMLGFGIAAAVRAWQLVVPWPGLRPDESLPQLPAMLLLVPGAFALVFCLQARLRDVGWVLTAVVLAYGTQELTRLVVGDPGSPFTAALVVGAGGELYRRWSGRTPVLFVVPGLFQLTPGFLGTRTILQRLLDPVAKPAENFADVLVVALQLVIGLFVGALLFRPRAPR